MPTPSGLTFWKNRGYCRPAWKARSGDRGRSGAGLDGGNPADHHRLPQGQGGGTEIIIGAGPNAPREDVYRLALQVARTRPEVILAVGGGSTIDAAKAANVLATFSPQEVKKALQAPDHAAGTIDPYFGWVT